MKKLTTEEFIKRAKEIHGDKYDYSLVDYKNNKTKVKIICPIHGVFEQKPVKHIAEHGCPKCGGTNRLNTEEFIKRAKEIHGDKYDYSLVDYKNNKTKVKIICPIHGVFEQAPDDHFDNCGCPKCGGAIKLNTEEFIKRAKEVHGDKYDYSLVNYKRIDSKVKIICPVHGVFEQRPHDHLTKHGCPFCKISKNEKKIADWLNKHGINYIWHYYPKELNKRSYDFYIENKNLLIEFNGVQHYKPIRFGGVSLEKAKQNLRLQRHSDWLKRQYAKKNGIKLLIISYLEIKNKKIENILEENIL